MISAPISSRRAAPATGDDDGPKGTSMLPTMLAPVLCLLPAYAAPSARASVPRMQATIEKVAVPAHENYLSEVALTMPPSSLSSMAGLLVSRGEELVEPGLDASMHPLLVPLTKSSDGCITGLLRWPAGGGGGSKLPLVRTTSDGQMLTLLANSMENFLLREAAVADVEGSADAAALAALSRGIGFPYDAGSAAAQAGGLPGFIITKVGPFIHDYESLSKGHMAKGNDMAGLVTCERSQNVFGAWGRPAAFHARTLASIGNDEEARDQARTALELPLWTLGDDLEEVLKISQTERADLLSRLTDRAAGKPSAQELRANNGVDKRSPKDVAKDRASYLLDLAVAKPEEFSWASIRAPLAELYREADMASIARFVLRGEE